MWLGDLRFGWWRWKVVMAISAAGTNHFRYLGAMIAVTVVERDNSASVVFEP